MSIPLSLNRPTNVHYDSRHIRSIFSGCIQGWGVSVFTGILSSCVTLLFPLTELNEYENQGTVFKHVHNKHT